MPTESTHLEPTDTEVVAGPIERIAADPDIALGLTVVVAEPERIHAVVDALIGRRPAIAVRADGVADPDAEQRAVTLDTARAELDQLVVDRATLNADLAASEADADASVRAEADRVDELVELDRRLQEVAAHRLELGDRYASLEASGAEAATAEVEAGATLERWQRGRDGLSAVLATVTSRAATHAEIVASLDSLSDELAVLGVDPAPLATWRAALADGTAALIPVAAELLAELDSAEAELASQGTGGLDDHPDVQDARAVRRHADSILAELDAQMSTGVLGLTTRREIEAAYEARVAAEERAGRRSGAELEVARQAEADALAGAGFGSYLDFTIVLSTLGTGELAKKQLELAAERLAEATAEMDQVVAEVTVRRDRAAAALDVVRDRIAAELGDADPTSSSLVVQRGRLAALVAVPSDVAELAFVVAASTNEADAVVGSARAESARLAGELASLPAVLDEVGHQIAALDVERSALAASLEAAIAHREQCQVTASVATAQLATMDERLERASTEVAELDALGPQPLRFEILAAELVARVDATLAEAALAASDALELAAAAGGTIDEAGAVVPDDGEADESVPDVTVIGDEPADVVPDGPTIVLSEVMGESVPPSPSELADFLRDLARSAAAVDGARGVVASSLPVVATWAEHPPESIAVVDLRLRRGGAWWRRLGRRSRHQH